MKKTNIFNWLCLQLLYCSVAFGQAGPASRPSYSVLRYDEDYSFLKDSGLRTDPFDPIKYVPLNSQGDWYASFGGQVRDRYEFSNNNLFGVGPQDDNGFNLLRVMVNADAHLGPSVRLFVQGISASQQGRAGGPRPADVDEFDLHQAFADLKLPFGDADSFTIRGGRQNLLFGAQRLIGPLDWANVRRTFDGVRGTFRFPDNTLDVFYVRPVQADKYNWDNDIPGTNLAGIYDTWKLPGKWADAHSQLEVYGLYVNREQFTFPTEGISNESRYTVGARLSGNPKPFDYDVETDYQFGRFNGGDIAAYSVASVLGYTLADEPFAPRIFAGFDVASGDRDAHDGKLQTFDQLFPTGHLYFGHIDAIGRQNIIDPHVGIEATLLKNHSHAQKVTFTSEYHQFWRESSEDAVYNAAGNVLRASDTNRSSSIGGEIDLLLNWQIDRHTNFYAGYGHFFPGDFIEQTGPHDPIDFVYASMTYTF